jgi:hypothetical protein
MTGTDIEIAHGASNPVLRLRRTDGHWVAANSGRAPVSEARAWLSTLAPADADVIVAIGMGLGYLLDALEEDGRRPTVVALEPHADIVQACMARRDVSRWIDERRLIFSSAPDFAELTAESTTRPDLFLAPAVLTHAVIQREHPAFVAEALARLDKARAGAAANATARKRFAGPYLVNTLCNRPAIEREADVDALEGLAAGAPAIVVGAGPSLDGALEAFQGADRRALIIATDTAARVLLGAGIAPHLVVAVDPAQVNGRHLRDLPRAQQTFLVTEGSVWPSAVAAFADRTFVFRVGNHDPWPWFAAGGLGVGRLRAWGSVITSAVDLAMRMGCQPIALVGTDCAPIAGQPYARGTTFEALWTARVLQGRSLPDQWAQMAAAWTGAQDVGLDGSMVETAPHLLAFRDWLAEEGRKQPGRLINASGQGLLHGPGIVQATLRDVLEKYSRASGHPEGLRGLIAEAYRGSALRRRAVRTMLPPAPDRAWSAIVDHSEMPAGTLERVMTIGVDAWVDAAAEQEDILVSPPAEAVVLLPSLLGGGAPPPWALAPGWRARVRAGAGADDSDDPDGSDPIAALAVAALDAVLREAMPETEGLFPGATCLASRVSGLSASAREALARLETVAACGLSACIERHPEALAISPYDMPMIGPDPIRGAVSLPQPFKTAALLQGIAALQIAAADLFSGPRAAATSTAADGRLSRLLYRAAAVLATGANRTSVVDATPVDVTIGRGMSDDLTATLPIAVADVTRALGGVTIEPFTSPASLRYAVRFEWSKRDSRARDATAADSNARDGTSGRPQFRWTLTLADRAGRAVAPGLHLEPGRLSPGVLPRCFLARTDGDRAVLSSFFGLETYWIDEAGHAGIAATWPYPLLGELAWGERGSLAWSNRDPWRVMWRDTPEQEPHEMLLPFRPAAACVDGRVVYFAEVTAGLWRWTPERGAEYLIDTPPIRAIRREGDGTLRLDPVALTAQGISSRLRLDHAYTWRAGQSTLDVVPLTDAGVCWSTAEGPHGWIAKAYPTASIIELSDPAGGRSVGLFCPYPFSLAWAGASLVVVSTTGGDVLLFERIVEVLRRSRRGD